MKRPLSLLFLAGLALSGLPGQPVLAQPNAAQTAVAGCDGVLVATSQLAPPEAPTVTSTVTQAYYFNRSALAAAASFQYSIDCWLQPVANLSPSLAIPGTVTNCSGTGATGLCTNPYFYGPAYPQIFLCTSVRYTDPSGFTSYQVDADPATPGVQCRERTIARQPAVAVEPVQAGCDGVLVATSQLAPRLPTVTGTATQAYYFNPNALRAPDRSWYSITCWLQPVPTANPAEAISGTTTICAGDGPIGACTSPYFYGPAYPRIFLCTYVSYADPTGQREYHVDADGNPANGPQCRERPVPANPLGG